ncbi:MAG: prepilin peptidase [Ignavibacteria bacterium]|nr:prepilin peptidase [Ignavibacteria bacterium]
MTQDEFQKKLAVPSTCPHCGHKLTSWDQVLLATDRALVCKKCWYTIIFDIYGDRNQNSPDADKLKNKEIK